MDDDLIYEKEIRMLGYGHCGRILSNVSIVFLLLSVALVATFVVNAIYIVINAIILLLMGIVMIVSLGLIFIFFPNYLDILKSYGQYISTSSDRIIKFGEVLFKFWPVIIPVSVICSLFALIFLNLDKTRKHTGRKIFSVIILLALVVVFIVLLVGGIK